MADFALKSKPYLRATGWLRALGQAALLILGNGPYEFEFTGAEIPRKGAGRGFGVLQRRPAWHRGQHADAVSRSDSQSGGSARRVYPGIIPRTSRSRDQREGRSWRGCRT